MRLKELRKKKGISQLRLATELSTTQNTISRYETGEREPGIAELTKIADYFNVSVDFLIANDSVSTPLDLGSSFYKDVSYYDLLNSCSKLPDRHKKIVLTMIESFVNELNN